VRYAGERLGERFGLKCDSNGGTCGAAAMEAVARLHVCTFAPAPAAGRSVSKRNLLDGVAVAAAVHAVRGSRREAASQRGSVVSLMAMIIATATRIGGIFVRARVPIVPSPVSCALLLRMPPPPPLFALPRCLDASLPSPVLWFLDGHPHSPTLWSARSLYNGRA